MLIKIDKNGINVQGGISHKLDNGDELILFKSPNHPNKKTEKLSLNKFAQEFHLHPNYIIRKFKDKTGYKLSEYLEKIRFEHAIQEIVNSEEILRNIAFDNGYFDQSHFNKVFKKQLSITPSQFKKILKG